MADETTPPKEKKPRAPRAKAAPKAAAEKAPAKAAAPRKPRVTKAKAAAPAVDLENRLYLELAGGRVVIDLRPDLAPGHVARIKELAREKYYDGIVFHRVIEGFMAQTGCPRGDGTGGTGRKLKGEFSDEPHTRGVCSMARTPDPNSADSQFFICFDDASFLDRQYTVWGKVVEGMDHVDAIKKGSRVMNGAVSNPDKIVTLRVAADVDAAA